MKIPSKAKLKKLYVELNKEFGKEVLHLGKYAGKEYGKIGASVADELGFLFTGVRRTAPKRRH